MKFIKYQDSINKLPAEGRHITATYDDRHIVVYQGFNKDIASRALKNGCFTAPFSFTRLSWIKPNFTWMMYRSEWGLQEEYILAVYLKRSFFEKLLEKAVYTQFCPANYKNTRQWRAALKKSEVRIQWDPDHDPRGKSLARRAIQLGLEGHTLKQYATRAIVKIEDMSDFVRSQRNFALCGHYGMLKVPEERIYYPKSEKVKKYLQI